MITKKVTAIAVAGALVLTVFGTVRAHHGTFGYEPDSRIELEGELSFVRWGNPHIIFTLLVEDESGETVEWQLEGGTANNSQRRGFTDDDFVVGETVRVAGRPAKSGRNELLLENILLPDGREAMLADVAGQYRWTDKSAEPGSATGESDSERSIFRVWSYLRLYKARAPFKFTDSAEAARANWNTITDNQAIQCIAPGMPNAILNPYPIELIDRGGSILLKIEEWGAERVINMMIGDDSAAAQASRLGYSVGRWEGDTLVVETSGIDYPYLDDEGTPMSDQARIVERFNVSEDGRRLSFELTVTDPENLFAPAVYENEYIWVPGATILPFECELN